MIVFDYIHSARPALVRRLLEVRVSGHLRAPLFALGAAISIVLSAWLIESYRLCDTAAIAAVYRVQYDQSRLDLSKAKVLYASLERMVALAKEVRMIRASGEEEAGRFAEIGNHLPPHAWLTAISNDTSGVSLSGKAVDLATLSRTIFGLASTRHRYIATLLAASRDDRTSSPAPLQYQLRLQGPSK